MLIVMLTVVIVGNIRLVLLGSNLGVYGYPFLFQSGVILIILLTGFCSYEIHSYGL